MSGFTAYGFDHYIVSSFYYGQYSSRLNISIDNYYTFCISNFLRAQYSVLSFTMLSIFNIESNGSIITFYLFDINRLIIFPLFSSFKLNILSFDVIHCLGLYSFGIKIDGIPGRIHLGSTLRSIFKGEHRGFCFELCGQGHSSMLIAGVSFILHGLFL